MEWSPIEILKGSSIHNLKCQIWEETIGFPGGIVVKNQPASAGGTRDASSVPGLGRSPGEGNGNALQYSCLENPSDRGAWWATYIPYGQKESDVTEHPY